MTSATLTEEDLKKHFTSLSDSEIINTPVKETEKPKGPVVKDGRLLELDPLVFSEIKREPDATPEYIEQSFDERVMNSWKKRYSEFEKYSKSAFKPIDVKGESLSSLNKRPDLLDIAKVGLGQAAFAALDLSGELINEGIDLVVPDSLEDFIKAQLVKGMNAISENPTLMEGLKVLHENGERGKKAYDKWAQENPNSATELESVVGLGTFFMPKVARKELGPVRILENPELTRVGNAASKFVENVIDKTKGAAVNQETRRKARSAYEYVMPFKVTKDRVGDVSPSSATKKARLEPTPLEQEAIEFLATLDIKPSRDYSYNYRYLDNYKQKLAQQTDAVVRAAGRNKQVPHSLLKSRLVDVIRKYTQGAGAADSASQQKARKLLNDLMAMVDASGTKPIDVLDLRKDFDRYLEKQFNFFKNKDIDPWLQNTGLEVRRAMNDIVDEALNNKAASKLLREQHLINVAQRGLGEKVMAEANQQGNQIIKNIKRVLGENVRMSRVIGYTVAGASGFGWAMNVIPYVTGAAAATGLAAIAVRGSMSPKTKRALAATLGYVNQAIKATNNKEMLAELRLGRAYLLQLSQLPVDENAPDDVLSEEDYQTETGDK